MTAASNQIIPNGSYNNVGVDFITPYTAGQAIVVATSKTAATGYIAFDGANTRLKVTTITGYAADAAMQIKQVSGTAGSLFLSGSTSTEATAAFITLYGVTHGSSPGLCLIEAGNTGASAKIQLAAQAAAGTIEFITNSALRWVTEADGDLAQDATNGGNVVFSKAGTGVILPVNAAVAAAGADQAAATLLSARLNYVNSGSGGVRLPSAVAGLSHVVVCNVSGVTINVYPFSGDAFLDGAADAAITLANRTTLICDALTTAIWSYVKSA